MLATWIPLGLCICCYLVALAVGLTRPSRPEEIENAEGTRSDDPTGRSEEGPPPEPAVAIRWSRVLAICMALCLLVLASVDAMLFVDFLRRPIEELLPPELTSRDAPLGNPRPDELPGLVVQPDTAATNPSGGNLEAPLVERFLQLGRSENVALKLGLLSFALLCIFFPLQSRRHPLLLVHLSGLVIVMLLFAAFGSDSFVGGKEPGPKRSAPPFPSPRRLRTVEARLIEPMRRYRELFDGGKATASELFFALDELNQDIPKLRDATVEYLDALDPIVSAMAEGGDKERSLLDELNRLYGKDVPLLGEALPRSRILWQERVQGQGVLLLRSLPDAIVGGSHALDAASGAPLWDWALKNAVPYDTDDEGFLYLRFASTPPALARVDPRTPIMLWSVPFRKTDVKGRVCLKGERLFTVTNDGMLVCYARRSGCWLWTRKLTPGAAPRCLATEAGLWIADGTKTLRLLGAKDGKDVSSLAPIDEIGTGPEGAEGGRFVFASRKLPGGGCEVLRFDATAGTLVERAPLPTRPRRLLALRDDLLLLKDESHLSLCRWAKGAPPTWSWRRVMAKGQLFGATKDLVLASTDRHDLLALSLGDGSDLWHVKRLSTAPLIASQVSGERLFLTTSKRELYAIALGAVPKARSTNSAMDEESIRLIRLCLKALSDFRDFEPWARQQTEKLVSITNGDDLTRLIPLVSDLADPHLGLQLIAALLDRGSIDLQRATASVLGGPLQKSIDRQAPPLDMSFVDFDALALLRKRCERQLPTLMNESARVTLMTKLMKDESSRVAHGAASMLARSTDPKVALLPLRTLAALPATSDRFPAILCALAVGPVTTSKVLVLTSLAASTNRLAPLALMILRQGGTPVEAIVASEARRKDARGDRARKVLPQLGASGRKRVRSR